MGFPADAYKEQDALHTWAVLCHHCYNYRGGWRNYIDMASEEYMLSMAKAHGAPGLSVQPACYDTIPFRFQNPFAPGFFLQEHPVFLQEHPPRRSSELQRQRYTICTPIHGAPDGVPPLGIMFKASPESRLANVADASVSGSLSQALPHETSMSRGSQDDEQMILAVRAYHESLYARQHLMWAKFLLQRWWNWVYRTPNWWLQCNDREAQREWIYD